MLSELVAVVFPAACPGCGRPAEPVCDECRASVRPPPVAPVPAGLDALVVSFAYTGVVRELVARAKYRSRHAALGWAAAELATAVLAAAVTADLVVWAPTTDRRRRQRGFDHAQALARRVGATIGLPVGAQLRRVGRDAQTGRARSERMGSPRFVAVNRARVAGRAVLLVDDVVTTGATMSSAASVLRSAGARAVIGAAVARRA